MLSQTPARSCPQRGQRQEPGGAGLAWPCVQRRLQAVLVLDPIWSTCVEYEYNVGSHRVPANARPLIDSASPGATFLNCLISTSQASRCFASTPRPSSPYMYLPDRLYGKLSQETHLRVQHSIAVPLQVQMVYVKWIWNSDRVTQTTREAQSYEKTLPGTGRSLGPLSKKALTGETNLVRSGSRKSWRRAHGCHLLPCSAAAWRAGA